MLWPMTRTVIATSTSRRRHSGNVLRLRCPGRFDAARCVDFRVMCKGNHRKPPPYLQQTASGWQESTYQPDGEEQSDQPDGEEQIICPTPVCNLTPLFPEKLLHLGWFQAAQDLWESAEATVRYSPIPWQLCQQLLLGQSCYLRALLASK